MIKAFIYSVFDARNHSRQMLYIYDPSGFSGKSAMIRAISKNLGEELVTVLQKNSEDQFVGSKVHGRRLIVRGDNKNPQFLRSEFIHMLTGGDQIEVNTKYRQSFVSIENVRIMAAGNVALSLDCDAIHEFSRIIVVQPHMTDEVLKDFCEVDENGTLVKRGGRPVPREDADFEQHLIDEFWFMMKSAKACYEELCPKHADIAIPGNTEDKRMYFHDDDLCLIDEFVANEMELGEALSMSIKDMKKLHISFLKGKPDHRDFAYENFVAHLTKKFGVRKISRKDGATGIPTWLFLGMRPKQTDEP